MSESLFIRLLEDEEKSEPLRNSVASIRSGSRADRAHFVEGETFRAIPGSPFAYWATAGQLNVFQNVPRFERNGRVARITNPHADDFRYFRLHWEVNPRSIGKGIRWVPIVKGGEFGRYYMDLHLVVDWDDSEGCYKDFQGTPHRPLKRPASSDFFFRPGLTWPSRTNGLSFRVLPSGSIFAPKGPTAFLADDDVDQLMLLAGLVNSLAFKSLVQLQLARVDLAQSYEVGLIQQTPVPEDLPTELEDLARRCFDIARDLDRTTETSHVFSIPGGLGRKPKTLVEAIDLRADQSAASRDKLQRYQQQIDLLAMRLYSLDETDIGTEATSELEGSSSSDVQDEEDAEPESFVATGALGKDLASWAMGCAFGRFDVRLATEPRLAPTLQEPFDPLPVCSPGMLVGPDGLPAARNRIVSEEWLRARPNVITLPPNGTVTNSTVPDSEYPIGVDWDGILVDDPEHEDDVVRRVRDVLHLIWGNGAEGIEQEACQMLGVKELRDWFRNPRNFWDDHIKRYSKSRRKAPIYWLVQSAKRSYGLWLYYHRLDSDIYAKALVNYVEPKVRQEETRLKELRAAFQAQQPSGASARKAELGIERHEALISELEDFRAALDRVVKLGLQPDLDDGVVLNIAPLHELVPWKVARQYWDELLAGKYEWSTISKQLRAKGLVR